ncbi:unnamed protein product [Strongylus vulgaris]|uniref:Uncharacterized protein n=1 Tax=Strongylus vulgaris TaxID=40348 RepID=A0A3P7I9G8_STRVU|nr:unnamed protein product [Strongylus vulgaris]
MRLQIDLSKISAINGLNSLLSSERHDAKPAHCDPAGGWTAMRGRRYGAKARRNPLRHILKALRAASLLIALSCHYRRCAEL